VEGEILREGENRKKAEACSPMAWGVPRKTTPKTVINITKGLTPAYKKRNVEEKRAPRRWALGAK